MKKKDTMKHEETMLTTVYDPQKSILRSARDIDSDRLYDSGDKLDRLGVRCK